MTAEMREWEREKCRRNLQTKSSRKSKDYCTRKKPALKLRKIACGWLRNRSMNLLMMSLSGSRKRYMNRRLEAKVITKVMTRLKN